MNVTVDLPEKLECLLYPKRYKIAHGGRGSAKSWSFARTLLAKGAQRKLRILCAREIQKSIKDSVHKLLRDQIAALNLGSRYKVFDTEIRGINGTEFLFTGLNTHTVDTIKSFEACDICWVEEGQTVRKKSWDILIPTIRKGDSEIWVSFNPDLETDETYHRFVKNAPFDSYVVEINWSDNPWWNSVMEAERLHCRKTDPENYDNIWEGKCRPAVEGAIYYKEVMAAEADGRICNVPYEPSLKVHVVFDLGWNDSMFISLIQRNLSEVRVIRAIMDDHRTLDSYSAELKELQYNWGKVWLPHDGYHGDYKTGKSSEGILRKLGWDVAKKDEIVQQRVEEGIKVSRLNFHRYYFDKKNADPLVESLKRYRRRINNSTEEEGTPVHDRHSHGADNFRYINLNLEGMRNEEERKRRIKMPSYGNTDTMIGM